MRVAAIRLVNATHKVSFGSEIDELLTWSIMLFPFRRNGGEAATLLIGGGHR